jgi:NADH-quinone oxidoreductase subunit N
MLHALLAPLFACWQSPDGLGVPSREIPRRFAEVQQPILDSVGGIWPELILAIAAMAVLLVDLATPRARSRQVTTLVAGAGLLLAFVCVWLQWPAGDGVLRTLFPAVTGAAGSYVRSSTGMLTTDTFASFLKLVFLIGTGVTAWFTLAHHDFTGRRMGEYWLLMLTAVLGMCLMVSSTDFLMAFLAIEMVSISSFVLVGYTREDSRASEAALKYVVYGAMASGLMLYGVSFFYGVTGTTRFAALPEMMQRLADPIAITAAGLFTLAGIAYKVAAAPLHFWCPDVYEGAPTPVTAWLSVTSKAAGVGLLVRVVAAADAQPGAAPLVSWGMLAALLAAATMTVGNLGALRQRNVKRLLAYSSIAHAGYLTMAVAAIGVTRNPNVVWQAINFYVLVYVCMNLGAFAIVLFVRNQTGSEDVETYRGLGWRQPWLAFLFTVLLFALIGIPPTAGFFGKLYLFQAVLDVDGGRYVWLAVVAGLNTAISAYYYMSLVKTMYLDEATTETPSFPFASPALGTVVALTVPVLVLGVFATPLLRWVMQLGLGS